MMTPIRQLARPPTEGTTSMTRRLSITVPDELWDPLINLEGSPSALVQRALRCLQEKVDSPAPLTTFETITVGVTKYQEVFDKLTEEAAELRAEGYESVVQAVHVGAVGLSWLELVAHGYMPTGLPRRLSQAADWFQSARALDHPDGSDEWLDKPVTVKDLEGPEGLIAYADLPGGQGLLDRERLFEGVCQLIVAQSDGLLVEHANGPNTPPCPSANIPMSFWEGMADAIHDTVASVRRRVRAENPLAASTGQVVE